MINILIFIFAYLFGSVSGSLIVSKTIFREDIRTKGSGNAGTTNTFRVYGKKYAGIAFLIDLLKGTLAVYLASLLNTEYGAYIAGSAVVIGHCWPIFHRFRGGKGMATSGGVNLFLSFPTAMLQLTLFIIINLSLGIVSLASLIVIIAGFISVLILHTENTPLIIMSAINMVIVIYSHRENIMRLIKGKENRTNLVKDLFKK